MRKCVVILSLLIQSGALLWSQTQPPKQSASPHGDLYFGGAYIQAYAKINAAGEWIDRTETTSMNYLFDRMSTEELKSYAQSGTLPGWFPATASATEDDSRKRLIVDV